MIELLNDLYVDLLQSFSSPQKRVFWGFLLCAAIVGFCWLKFHDKLTTKHALHFLFSRDIWLSRSAIADYFIFIINKASFLFIAPLLLTQLTVAVWLFEQLHLLFEGRPRIGAGWPDWTIMLLFTSVYFVLDDFARFYLHKLLHEVPALWAFHKVHHSARVLTPITVFRTHPVEGVLFSIRTVLVQAISLAGFVFFFGDRADLITVLGASVLAFVFNILGSNLRHSHVPLRYGKTIERWLISPKQHQIHHSVETHHFDKNYGVVFAVWDRIFGSLVLSKAHEKLSFGLQKQVKLNEHSMIRLYILPFYESFKVLVAFSVSIKSIFIKKV